MRYHQGINKFVMKDLDLKKVKISEATVARLPKYIESLKKLSLEGEEFVSSQKLAKYSGVGAPQLRKDLASLGDFGFRGRGYDVKSLCQQLSETMGLNKTWQIVIVGYGKLGAALANYTGFPEKSFRVVAVFDKDPLKVGKKELNFEVYHIKDLNSFVKEHYVDIAIIATPASEAQEVADQLVQAGIKSILNFAPIRLETPSDTVVRQVDLAVEIQILSFYENFRNVSKFIKSFPIKKKLANF